MNEFEKDWKLKLKYGKISTPFNHFTVIAKGEVGNLEDEFECPKGPAYMGMKVWTESISEAAEMIQVIGKQIGFLITGETEIFETEPQEPPRENPFGYDINFTPFLE